MLYIIIYQKTEEVSIMRELTIDECSIIYGGGIGLGEALEAILDGAVEAAHASEGAVSLAEALGAFEDKNGTAVSRYTTDKDVLNLDVDIANTYMHDIQTHTGSDKLTDSGREEAIHELQNDGRVYFNPLENKFEALGGAPENGSVTKEDLKDPDVNRFYEYCMNQDIKDLHSSDPSTVNNAIDAIKSNTRDGAYHYSVTQGKFVVG